MAANVQQLNDVGAVERVIPESVAINLTDSDIAFLVPETANSNQAKDTKSENWFGRTVAKHFGLNIGRSSDRLKVDNVIRRLTRRGGPIQCEERRDARDRHKRYFLCPSQLKMGTQPARAFCGGR